MPRSSIRKPTVTANQHVDARPEVGRFVLEGRVYTIIQSAELGKFAGKLEAGRFELGKYNLVVLTADEDCQGDSYSHDDIATKLTGRELEIAILVARGLATKNIAHKLQISEWTVATYMRRVFAKLGVYSRAAMVYRCASLIEKTNEYYNAKLKANPSRLVDGDRLVRAQVALGQSQPAGPVGGREGAAATKLNNGRPIGAAT